MKRTSLMLLFVGCLMGFSQQGLAADKAGLVGIQYGSEDFDNAEKLVVLSSLDNTWSEADSFGKQWSGRWEGFLVGPVDGEVKLTVEADQKANVVFVDNLLVTGVPAVGRMVKGQKYPVTISYVKTGNEYDCYLRVKWSWAGQAPSVIGGSSLVYAEDVEAKFDEIVAASDDDDEDDDDGSRGVLGGILYDSVDFTNPRSSLDILPSLDVRWGAERGKGWSARWYGGVNGPYFGNVTFTAETNGKVRLTIAGYVIIDTITKDGPLTAVTKMSKDGGDWIQIEFVATESPSYLRIYWQWPGQPKAIVFADELKFDEDDIPGYGVEDQGRDDEDDKVSPLLPRFTGGQPSVVNLEYHDGRVRPIVGVHNFQVMRSNRTKPKLAVKDIPYYPEDGYENIGFTYNHAPMLCYWRDMFWLFYRSGPAHEHQEPCYNLITWSEDGRNWEKPETIFPAKRFRNRNKDNQVQYSIAH